MLDTPAPMRRSMPLTSAAALVRAYLLSRGDGLATALERLGGRPAFSRYCRLRESLRTGRASFRRIETELRLMLELLTLEHVGDPDRDASAYFAAIDPCDPDVLDYCVLAEEVEALHCHVRRLMLSTAAGGPAAKDPAPFRAHYADTVGPSEAAHEDRVAA